MNRHYYLKTFPGWLKATAVLVILLTFTAAARSQSLPQKPSEGLSLPIVAREAWQSVPAVTDRMSVQGKIKGIVIHHTAGRAPVEKDEAMILQNIQSFHMTDKKWGDIAYHYLIAPSGKIYEGRNPLYLGDSGTRYDTNGYLMICFLGTYDKHLPSPQARYSLKKIIKNKLAEYSLVADNVCCHRDLAQTDCPGNALYAWAKLQRWSEKIGQADK